MQQGKKEEKKDSGLTVSTGLSITAYSQASSHYRLARKLLPAAFQPWAGSLLIIQPGHVRTPPEHPY